MLELFVSAFFAFYSSQQFIQICIKNTYPTGLCMLSCFSHIWLFATLWTIAVRLLCSWDSSGKNTVVGCHALLLCPDSEIQPVSLGPLTLADRFFTTSSIWEAHKIVVQFSSVTQSCPTLCDPMDCSTPGFPVYHQLPEFTQTHVHWVGDAIQPSHPLLSPSPPTFNLSQHQVFSFESVLCIRWPKYCSFSFSISPSNEYWGLISFRMDWLDHIALQRTLKGLLQHHSSKASILRCSAFFIIQLSNPYLTTGKTIALTRQTSLDKVMSLLLNMLSRLFIAFLPRNKHFLISWLQLLGPN